MATFPIRSVPTKRTYSTATITTAADGLSDVIDLGGHNLCGIQQTTAGWTAADLTFMGAASSSAAMASIRSTTAST